jgi:hypothetical protein
MDFTKSEVFTIPHEFWWIPSGMSESARICWNSVGWSLSHSGFQFHGHSDGICRNLAEWLESGSLLEQFPLESIGILTRFHRIHWNYVHSIGIPLEFQRNIVTAAVIIIKKISACARIEP